MTRRISERLLWALCVAAVAGCQAIDRENLVYPDPVPRVEPSAETTPVPSMDDAADDPAIWIHPTDASRSLVIGTDKDSGVGTWRLDGSEISFVAAGLPNNIDLRQGVTIGGETLDLAAASNRDGDRISLYRVDETGVSPIGDFPAARAEPYGFCLATTEAGVFAVVTYKTGEVDAWRIEHLDPVRVSRHGTFRFESQLEGCVHDDASGRLYIGEEARGIWRMWFVPFNSPALIDEIDGASGITADIEGVALYRGEGGHYLIASSQGNDSYAVYDIDDDHAFVGRFRVGPAGAIDGSQETDGIDATGASLGSAFPRGMLVVQDGYNAPDGSAQNFKLIDWRRIEAALGLPR